MARYVVLSFEDNDEAEEFVQAHKYYIADKKTNMHGTYPEVVGLYAQPTQFCPNSGSGGCSQNKRVRAWARGQKYGWWVCCVCSKPSNANLTANKLAGQVIRTGVNLLEDLHKRIIPQSVNLLPEEPDPSDVADVRDEGWGVMSRH